MPSGVIAICSQLYETGHNVEKQNVFLEFDNGLYAIMSNCPLLIKNDNLYILGSPHPVLLIRTYSQC